MQKKLIKHGNSYALVIDKPILEMLKISQDTPLELSTNGDAIMVMPVRESSRQEQLAASLEKINKAYSAELKKLAE